MDDHLKIDKDSPLFRKMLADAPAVEEESRIFEGRFAELIQKDDEVTGTILRCHLVVEHFLDDYLTAAHPGIPRLSSMRLTFHQKLEIADHPRTNFTLTMPGLRCLNALRNQLVHNVNKQINPTDLQPIQEMVSVWRTAGGYDVPTGVAAIQD